jgi:MFS family permease
LRFDLLPPYDEARLAYSSRLRGMTMQTTVRVPFIRLFLFLCFGSLLFWVGLYGIITVLPLHMQALGYSEKLAGGLMGLGSLSALGFRLVFGGVIDRYGPRPALVAGGLLLLLSTVAGHPVLALPGMVLLNLLQGIALTLLLSAGLAAASAVAPPAKRGTAVAWYGLASSLASLIAAPLAVPLFTNRGFGAVQLLVCACGLGAGLLGALVSVRPEVTAEGGGRQGALLLPSAVRPGLMGAVMAVGAGGFMLAGPLKAHALGLPNPGLYMTVEAGTLLLSRMSFGPISDRRGRGWAIVPGLLLLATGFALMGAVSQPLLALAAPALIGAGIGAAAAGLIAWTVDRASAGERGRAINTYYLFYELALFVGMTGVGYLVSTWADWAYGGVAVVIILGLLFYVVPVTRKRAKTEVL